MKKVNLILLISIAFIIISCSKHEDKPAVVAIIPLQTGNTWTYADSTFHTTYLTAGTSVLSVGDYVNIKGTGGFKMYSIDNSFHITFLADIDDQGNFILVGGYSDKDTLLTLTYQYIKSAQKGSKWTYQELSVNPETGIFESQPVAMNCVNADTTIHTPKGDFKCKVYSYTPDEGRDVMYNYISEGVGVIKTTHYEDNRLFNTSTLIDYKLK
jgi:hypothetical protein